MKYIQLFEIPILCFFLLLFFLESSGSWGATSEAFIFSLNNHEGLAPFVSKVKKKFTGNAIYGHSDYGPMFGWDLVIYNDAPTIRRSGARLDRYYTVPDSVGNRFTILDGPGVYFLPDEVEVFYLDVFR